MVLSLLVKEIKIIPSKIGDATSLMPHFFRMDESLPKTVLSLGRLSAVPTITSLQSRSKAAPPKFHSSSSLGLHSFPLVTGLHTCCSLSLEHSSLQSGLCQRFPSFRSQLASLQSSASSFLNKTTLPCYGFLSNMLIVFGQSSLHHYAKKEGQHSIK